jgi:hypothetical protein
MGPISRTPSYLPKSCGLLSEKALRQTALPDHGFKCFNANIIAAAVPRAVNKSHLSANHSTVPDVTRRAVSVLGKSVIEEDGDELAIGAF